MALFAFSEDDFTSWDHPHVGTSQSPFRFKQIDFDCAKMEKDYMGFFRDDAGVVIGPLTSPPKSQSSRWWITDPKTVD